MLPIEEIARHAARIRRITGPHALVKAWVRGGAELDRIRAARAQIAAWREANQR